MTAASVASNEGSDSTRGGVGFSRPVIGSLQAGRAAAALAVVGYHAGATVTTYVGAMPSVLQAILSRGYLGVDFFFVLSGYIMTHVNLGKTPTRRWGQRYAQSRLMRIFVPYLPVGVGLALLYTAFPALSNSSREWGWYETLTLLPGTVDPALLVAWTLQHEMMFYILFLLFALTRHPFIAATIWAIAIVLFNLLIGSPARPSEPLLAMINLEFLFGMMAARFTRNDNLPAPAFLAAGVGTLGIFVATGGLSEDRVWFGLATALVLVPIVRLEHHAKLEISRMAVFLGGASYAIYLIHTPALALLARMAPANWATALIWFTVASTAAGIAYHLLIERPGLTWAKTILSRSDRA